MPCWHGGSELFCEESYFLVLAKAYINPADYYLWQESVDTVALDCDQEL